MIQILKCDSSTKTDKYPCGDRDHIWNTLIETSDKDTFSIGSFVTPYGKWLKLGKVNNWTWTYDITNYSPILRGECNLTVGNNQKLLYLKFLFIKGTPERNVISFENLHSYGKYECKLLSYNKVLKKRILL